MTSHDRMTNELLCPFVSPSVPHTHSQRTMLNRWPTCGCGSVHRAAAAAVVVIVLSVNVCADVVAADPRVLIASTASD